MMWKRGYVAIMILFSWGGLMGGDAYERGLSYLLEQVSGEVSEMRGMEGGLLLRTLYLQFGQEALEWREGLDAEKPGERTDLCAFMESMWRHDFLPGENGAYINEDGGWPADVGGASDIGATVLGISYLLDAAGSWHEDVIEDGVEFLRNTCCQDGHWDSFQVPRGCGDGGVAGRLEFFVLLGQLYREGLLKDREQEAAVRRFGESLGKALEESAQGRSCYETGLYLRGLSLLGLQGRGRHLVDWLEDCQQEDGSWSDRQYGSDVTVTCVVVDGLGAACHPLENVTTEIRWQRVDEHGNCTEVSDVGEGNVLRLEIPDGSELASSVTVYDASGEVVASHGTELVRGSFPLWYRQFSPGRHEVVVRFWCRPGLGYCGESRHVFEVPSWCEVERVSVSPSGVPRRVKVGSAVELSPEVSVICRCNGVSSGQVTCHVEGSGGERLLDFGSGGFRLEPSDSSCHVGFAVQTLVFPFPGHYFLVIGLRLGEVFREERVLIIAETERTLAVENWLEPAALDCGRQVGRVHFRLQVLGGEDDGLATEIGPCLPDEILIGVEDMTYELRIDGIRDGDGGLVRRGVLALRTYKGRLVGGECLAGEADTEHAQAFPIVEGSCVFRYHPGLVWRNCVNTLKVCGAVRMGDRVECLQCIGSFELGLNVTKALQRILLSNWYSW